MADHRSGAGGSRRDREWRSDAALGALGRLPPADEAAVEAATDADPVRRAELAELRRVAALLALAEEPDERPPPAPSAIADRVVAAVVGRRRRRIVASAVAALVAAAVVLVAFVAGGTDRGSPVPFSRAPEGVTASFALDANGAGTSVRLHVEGLDDGVYWLWLTDGGGRRTVAGSFTGGDEPTSLVLQAALPTDDTRRVWVTDASDGVVLDAVLGDEVPIGY